MIKGGGSNDAWGVMVTKVPSALNALNGNIENAKSEEEKKKFVSERIDLLKEMEIKMLWWDMMEKFHFPRKRNKQMLRFANFALIFLICASGCSVFETVETKEYAMTWKVKRDQTNKGHHLVEFEFVDFPGHVIGHYS